MLLDVSHWSSQEGPWMPSTMWCMQVVCFSTSWWPASIAVVDARCTCHTPGGPTDESHWPLGDPSTAHHLRSVVSLPMLPSFKVLCILLSVCLWRSHRPRSCTLGGPGVLFRRLLGTETCEESSRRRRPKLRRDVVGTSF